jgi:prevent-host-death family protein
VNTQIESIPKLIPMSDLRIHQNSVLARIAEGPVVLTQHGRAAAVLVEPDLWNELVQRLEDLQDTLDVMRGHQEMQEDPASVVPWEEVRAELRAREQSRD